MKRKISRFLISTIIGTIGYFAFGWLVFDFILGNYTAANTTQLVGFKKQGEESSISLIVFSCGAYAALISYIFVYLMNNNSLLKAFITGSIIGILVAIMTDTYWYATSYFYSNITVVILDILAAGITVGFMAILIAFINRNVFKNIV